MLCPHCHRPVSRILNGVILEKAKILKRTGYSLRAIQNILYYQGHDVSRSTLSRYFKEASTK